MCTVTFVPGDNGVLLGSSRDENTGRTPALSPQWYGAAGKRLLYPRDPKSGGTWIAMGENGHTGILLNGAFIQHEYRPPYSRSRGTILPAILLHDEPLMAFRDLPLAGVEPFTLVLYGNNTLFECRWDEKVRHIRELDAATAHIWSSATLYDETMATERRSWFNTWLAQHSTPSADALRQFHLTGGMGADAAYAIRMERKTAMRTVSITIVALTTASASMGYTDLLNEAQTELNYLHAPAAASADV